jgi:hypothetical protein
MLLMNESNAYSQYQKTYFKLEADLILYVMKLTSITYSRAVQLLARGRQNIVT